MPCGLDCHDCLDPTPSIPSDYSIPGYGIQRNCHSAKWALVVRSAKPQTGWVEHRPRRTPFEAVKPATAVRFQGQIFRLMEAEESPAGWRYRFVLWPPNEPPPPLVDLTPESIREARAATEFARRSERLSRWAPFYEFVFGFLPARAQIGLGETYCFDPEHASRKNGFVQFLAFFALGAVAAVHYFTSPARADFVMAIVSLVVAVEGLFRWGQALVSGEPIGFLPFELLDRLLHRAKAEHDAAP